MTIKPAYLGKARVGTPGPIWPFEDGSLWLNASHFYQKTGFEAGGVYLFFLLSAEIAPCPEGVPSAFQSVGSHGLALDALPSNIAPPPRPRPTCPVNLADLTSLLGLLPRLVSVAGTHYLMENPLAWPTAPPPPLLICSWFVPLRVFCNSTIFFKCLWGEFNSQEFRIRLPWMQTMMTRSKVSFLSSSMIRRNHCGKYFRFPSRLPYFTSRGLR